MRDFFSLKLQAATPGQVILAFRKNFSITQKELSEVTGIAESNLSAIEQDKVELGAKRAALIAAAFGVEPGIILFPKGFEGSYASELEAIRKAASKLFAKKKKLKGP